MVSVLEWFLTGLGAVVVGVVLGAMLLLGVLIAKVEEAKRTSDGESKSAVGRVSRVRRRSQGGESIYIRRG